MPRVPNPNDGQFPEDGRLPRGLMTPRSVYRRNILRFLLGAEQHALKSRDIRRAMQRRLMGRLTDADMSFLRLGQPRWVNAMQWERKEMVIEGLLEGKDAAGHGRWRLTREGVRVARANNGG